MDRKQVGIAFHSHIQPKTGWSDALGDKRYRHSRTTAVIPHLGSKSSLVWRREDLGESSKLQVSLLLYITGGDESRIYA